MGVGMKAVKAGTKAAKAMSKISKITRKVEEFYNALNSIASIVRIYKERDFYLQLGKDMLKGDFDITDPKDASRLMKVAQTAAPFMKSALNKSYKKHQEKKSKGGDIEPQKQRKTTGNESEQDKQTCKYDPINVMMGSQTLVYTDFVIHDIAGEKYLQRTYESIYENRGNHFGSY